MPARDPLCPNFNHRRRSIPVRFCPRCGDGVDGEIPIRQCGEEAHAIKRRNRQTYCVDCGERLAQRR